MHGCTLCFLGSAQVQRRALGLMANISTWWRGGSWYGWSGKKCARIVVCPVLLLHPCGRSHTHRRSAQVRQRCGSKELSRRTACAGAQSITSGPGYRDVIAFTPSPGQLPSGYRCTDRPGSSTYQWTAHAGARFAFLLGGQNKNSESATGTRARKCVRA